MIRIIESMKRSITLIIGRAVIDSIKTDNGLKAEISLIAGEKHSGVPFFQHYGIASKPNKGSEAVVLFVGGSRDNGICIASQGDASKIPSLLNGEVCVFSEFGQKVLLKSDGSIEIEAASTKSISFKSDISVTGKITSSGNIESSADVKAGAISLSLHTHSVPLITPGEGTATSATPQ